MSGFADYERYDALGLADLVRRKEVSPEDLLDAAIESVEARNQAVNAVMMPLYDFGAKGHRGRSAGRSISRRAVSPERPGRMARGRQGDARLALFRRCAGAHGG